MKKSRLTQALAIASIGILTSSACAPVDTGTNSDTALAWERCEGTAECATVSVPLDYEAPNGKKIDLAVLRVPATGKSEGTLFYNPGGPGAEVVSDVATNVSTIFSARVRESYDIIAIDPRGVGRSTPVKCPVDDEVDASENSEPPTEQEIIDDAKQIAAGCEELSGDLLPHITTENAARDMDMVRSALGEQKLNYLGFSYGTTLGAAYADLFPKNVGRMVLDSATDPDLNYAKTISDSEIAAEQLLKAYLKSAQAQELAPFSGSVDDAYKQLTALIDRYDNNPAELADGSPFDGNSIRDALLQFGGQELNWPNLTVFLRLVQTESIEDAALLSRTDFLRDVAEGSDSDDWLSLGAHYAYTCTDWSESTQEQVAEANNEAREQAPLLGMDFEPDQDPCTYWPVERGKPLAFKGDGAPPIVVIGITNDIATPFPWSLALAGHLGSARHVTYEGVGHAAYNNVGSACIDEVVEDMLLDGTAPEDGLVCKD
ncbi:alpha/beta hydrolase [Microbacterium sp.]|uniref:alpha/beta hydrolase n=1 Tax=Microbacterium sp. TaxID=51671 RepID=UPI003A84D75E